MEARQMATMKLSDEALLAILHAHPDLRDRIASIALAVENSEGDLKEADAAEERIVEEMRLLGREAMQGGAEKRVEVTEQEIRRQPHMHRQGKKTPLAYEIRRNRTLRAAIPVRKGTWAPVGSQRERRSSWLLAAPAAGDPRFCRRSTLRAAADQVAGALRLRNG